MNKIKHFIQGNVVGCGCNLACSYCYLRQANYDQERKKNVFKYSMDVMRKAVSTERLGGSCLFSITGDGETLFPKEVLDLVDMLLEEGHYVMILTNGTLTQRIRELIERVKDKGKIGDIHILFSFHYMELKKKKLLDTFFDNIKYVHAEGCSFHTTVTLGENIDEEVADEIKYISLKELGANPHVAIARKDNPDGSFGIYTDLQEDRYFRMGEGFDSNLFKLDWQEFNNRRNEFCYAGDWMFGVNYSTGHCWQCLSNDTNSINFFEDTDSKLDLKAVGYRCNRAYCSCCNFQGWGVMPEHKEMTWLEIYDRPEAGWVKGNIKEVFAQKLWETNELYSDQQKKDLECWYLERALLNRRYYLININFREKRYEGLAQEIRDVLAQTAGKCIFWVRDLLVTYARLLALCGGGQPEEDLEELLKYYETMKDNSTYVFQLGYVYLKNAQMERAKELFSKVVNLSDELQEREAASEILTILQKNR